MSDLRPQGRVDSGNLAQAFQQRVDSAPTANLPGANFTLLRSGSSFIDLVQRPRSVVVLYACIQHLQHQQQDKIDSKARDRRFTSLKRIHVMGLLLGKMVQILPQKLHTSHKCLFVRTSPLHLNNVPLARLSLK